ncbi:UDP-glucose-4-epimerase [Prochlorococcus marinus subsp. pastoris str. CCMP1986]|uniref:UDP-glucose 4-epimerase n=1 Tax=Prochlorococcus marinus subsp. pastoris (strain CCMP1986 / NIES-2087 / MED4) TaxID=59919 RepID=Q7V0P7_PROMP|nr:UDP-glucose 4-epimerase GalE [Prochlorococcus marinus]KGF87231.1 UDP-glucose 4-epimerase [Prochlorococcus marinus str. EQPAC1]CAE19668.1 UDP-glucose-4-epimerase [Prochlorococcus marinus subsp. pastoris str. CCMP1986]
MNNILITGGAGYLGSHACLNLLEAGYGIYIVDSLENSSFESISRVNRFFKEKNKFADNKIKFFKADITNFEKLKIIFEHALCNNQKIIAVLHFAGLKAVSESEENPIKYWEYNVSGSINLFKVMELYDCKNIVFSSSAAVYGNNQNCPIKEDSSLIPSNVYGKTKKTIEEILTDLHFRKNWGVAILRYFNPVGAHHSGIIGENPISNKNNLFPIICEVAKDNNKKLNIFGKDWPTRDGTCLRDYVHVEDIIDGHEKALRLLLNSKHNLIKVNLGTGKGTTVLELINTFKKVNDIKIEYEFSERRIGDCGVLFADSRLSNSILNWKARKTLDDICRDGWRWGLKNPYGYIKNLEELDLSIYCEI